MDTAAAVAKPVLDYMADHQWLAVVSAAVVVIYGVGVGLGRLRKNIGQLLRGALRCPIPSARIRGVGRSTSP